ncbi:conserved hypothetical protein [Methanocella arvoryzae MRE50]|uniref:Uncharacterized protein n=1 Tax=Methanocella arvoryzae (strain DSM 22066 / NBRC 105507 / MRE50) TaxID=351160 RepID=Q0W7L2_METAR|nr:conserved hypothetical protein [Methanocella arvoryzae MRE50]
MQDRGIIAKIQSMIPGFSGYRAKEDLRAADNMLRIQVADRLASIRGDFEECRTILLDNGQMEGLDKIGILISKFKTVEGEIRHAAQGYSGIDARIRVGEDRLNKLYEYDLNMVTLLTEIKAEVDRVKSLAVTGGPDYRQALAQLAIKLDGMQGTNKRRMAFITGTEV